MIVKKLSIGANVLASGANVLASGASLAPLLAGSLIGLGAIATEAQAITLEFDSQIGSPGFGPGELFVPQGVSVQDSTGNIYVGNGRGLNPDGTPNFEVGNEVSIFSPTGEYIGAVGSGGTGPGEFDEPSALEFSPKTGNLYVGDVFNNRVNVYDPNGNYIQTLADGEFGGLIPGRAFFGPSGITFDEDNNVYVGDFSNDRILKINEAGEIIDTIGTAGTEPGQFQGPAGIRISPVSGNIYVADQFNNRVQVLDPEGNPLLVFGTEGTEPGQFLQPIGLEVDEEENIFVADSINSRVQVFDKEGNFLTTFGEPARTPDGEIVPPPMLGEPPFGMPLDLRPGVFNWTGGTGIDDDKLYVGDFFQGRVQVLSINYHDDAAKVPEPTSVFALVAGGFIAAKLLKKRQTTR
ncbi:MAG: scytonemin biosynthesis PEP-CTERM protein ScyF [Lyngbya sp.]|nr:scytonemin biosynthesis PEP-CTERM protein ScyF [Lyngbya sp.]